MVNLNSQKQYAQTYLSLIKKANSEKPSDIYKYIVNSKVKDATKLSYLNSIISLKKIDASLVKGDLTDIAELRDKLNVKIENDRKDDNIRPAQKEALSKITHEKLKEFVSELNEKKSKNLKSLEDYILVNLMVNYPLRNDLQEILLSNHKTDLKNPNNILYVPKSGEAILSLKEYKTRHAKGAEDIVIKFGTDVSNDIRNLIKHDINRKYLFTNNEGGALSSSSFTHRLNRIFNNKFGIPMSSTIIRKIYLSSKYKDTLDEMAKDAVIMGHSPDTAQKIYVNNKDRVAKL